MKLLSPFNLSRFKNLFKIKKTILAHWEKKIQETW